MSKKLVVVGSCFLKLSKRSLKFAGTTFAASFLGIISVALILSFLNCITPNFYKWLTYWANQKQVPTVLACKFKKILAPNFNEMKQYTWYEVDISLSNKKEIASALVYSTNEYMSIQKNTGKIRLTTAEDDPYIVLWRLLFNKNLPSLRVQAQNEYLNFKENVEYPYYECPIKVEFFIDE